MKLLKGQWNCFWHMIIYNIVYNQFNHCEIKEGIQYKLFKIPIWFKINKLSCTCNKVFYERKK